MNTYGPSLVKDLGFAGYSANGLQAPGSALALIISVSLAWNRFAAAIRPHRMILNFIRCSAIGRASAVSI